MALLEIRDAGFERRGKVLAPPVHARLDEGEHLAYACESELAASTLAMMAAGIVTPSSGRIFVGAFDPRIQPVQAKRMVGYVPHEAVQHSFSTLERYAEYRAALWGLPRAQAVVRARALLQRLDGMHEAFAYPLIGALLAQPKLLVLDRPQATHAAQIAAAARGCAVFSTHASENAAQRFRLLAAVPV